MSERSRPPARQAPNVTGRLVLAGVRVVVAPVLWHVLAAAAECAGVTVVVDDGTEVHTGCAPAGVSGLQALEEAGFSVYTTDHGGFVCQIDGKPEKSKCKDSANKTTWYYFYAGDDGEWTSSSLGAGNRTVIEGGYEGWNFGPKEPPDFKTDAPADSDSDSSASDSPESDSPASSSSDDSTSLATWIAGAVVIVVIIASIVVSIRRRT